MSGIHPDVARMWRVTERAMGGGGVSGSSAGGGGGGRGGRGRGNGNATFSSTFLVSKLTTQIGRLGGCSGGGSGRGITSKSQLFSPITTRYLLILPCREEEERRCAWWPWR